MLLRLMLLFAVVVTVRCYVLVSVVVCGWPVLMVVDAMCLLGVVVAVVCSCFCCLRLCRCRCCSLLLVVVNMCC